MNISEILVTSDDFISVEWQEILNNNPDKITCESLNSLFLQEANNYEENSAEWKALMLLAAISGFVLNYDQDSDEIFIPKFIFETTRGFIPDDFTKDQYEELSKILNQIEVDDLKARLADILWLKRIGDKPYEFGILAIDSYLRTINCFLSSDNYWGLALLRIKRVIHLTKEINSKQDEVRTKIEEYIEEGTYKDIVLLELLEILEKYYGDVKIDAEKISREFAERLTDQKQYLLADRCWQNNAKWNSRLENKESSRIALKNIAEIYEEQANKAMDDGQFSQASHFWEQAIHQYRKIEGTEIEREFCKRQLLECQNKIPESLIPKTFEVSIEKMVEIVKARFEGHTLQEQLLILGLSETSPEKEDLRKQVTEILKDHPLLYLVQRIDIDDHGRTVSKSNGFDLNRDNEELLLREMHSHSKYHQSFFVVGYILPAIRKINLDHNIRMENISFLVQNNPYIPPEAEYLILKGIHAGFKEDFIVSAHILSLQFEGVIRYILNQNGTITSSLNDEGIQEEYDINRLLYMPETTEYFGEDIVFDLQGLLISRYGSNFRNKLAHSLLSSNECYGYSSIYLWWIFLRIICVPFHNRFMAILEEIKNNQED